MWSMPARRFAAFAQRIGAYEGVITARQVARQQERGHSHGSSTGEPVEEVQNFKTSAVLMGVVETAKGG